MAGSKEIRTKIKSVQNTRKITKAMEMVAASKMRKAQERMRHARPYGDKIRQIVAHLAHANSEFRHPFLEKREGVKDVGIIVVTPPSSPMRRATARTVGSGECPGIEPVSPSAKSTYSLPSTSTTRAPRASE